MALTDELVRIKFRIIRELLKFKLGIAIFLQQNAISFKNQFSGSSRWQKSLLLLLSSRNRVMSFHSHYFEVMSQSDKLFYTTEIRLFCALF